MDQSTISRYITFLTPLIDQATQSSGPLPDLRAEIERLRNRPRPTADQLVPDRQRASDASLRRRREIATRRILELETDDKQLRHALAEALGERRAAGQSRPRHDTPKPPVSRAIGPC